MEALPSSESTTWVMLSTLEYAVNGSIALKQINNLGNAQHT